MKRLVWAIPFLFILVFCGCKSQKTMSKSEKLEQLLQNEYKVEKPVDKIFVLNGMGCSTCNRIFSKFLQEYDAKKTIYLISDHGQFLDIDSMNSSSIQVVEDYKNLLIREKIIEPKPAFIKLKNNKIDTIINFSVSEISGQLKYIQELP